MSAVPVDARPWNDVPFVRVPVLSDTAEWEAERRHSLGASDVPAMLGLSPYATPLDVYRAKFGVDRDMDPELAFIGHAEEVVIGKWMRAFRPELGVLRRGFMARSREHQWLHASFDRFVVKRGHWRPVQMKTAHQYASADWAEEQVPIAVQAQVQAELLVFGGARGYAVAFIGGRRFQLVPIDRDEEFLNEILIPQGRRFWHEHVLAKVPPDPTTPREAASLWTGTDDDPLVADEQILDAIASLRYHQQVAKDTEQVIDDTKLEIQMRMQERRTLLAPDGKTVLATWNPTKESTYTATRKAGRRFTLKPPPKETP